MTPDEFRAIREQRYVKPMVMADAIGVTEETVRAYERGKFPVPERIVNRLLHGVGEPCPQCKRTIVTAWFDGLCGGCSALILPEGAR